MAAGSTIHKAQLSISDMDRNYYETHELTVAKHPSETDKRLMLRLAAFALNATDRLIITTGIDAEDEPALWEKDYGGDIKLWIEIGQPDEKRVRKACGRSEKSHHLHPQCRECDGVVVSKQRRIRQIQKPKRHISTRRRYRHPLQPLHATTMQHQRHRTKYA